MARLGPSAGILVSSRTPAGTSARSSSTARIVPVSRYSAIFSAIDLPTPGICRSAAASSCADIGGWPATARAAFS